MTAQNQKSEKGSAGTNDGPKQRKRIDWLGEIKGLAVLLLIVLGIHSLIAKPFYIPSISMMPTLLVGDRLVVTKYPYGWSWVSPSFHLLPPLEGRVLGRVPERGDIVILTPPGETQDYIKRVVGLPGDIFEMRDGQIFLNGRPVKQEVQPALDLPVDANNPCSPADFPGALQFGDNGEPRCMVNIVRETLPNGVTYDTIDARQTAADNVAPLRIPAGHLYLLGDNRDNSADSRVPAPPGLGGPVPLENIGGRAELVTFSLDGSSTLNPVSWFSAMRSGRIGTSLRPQKVPADDGRPAATSDQTQ